MSPLFTKTRHLEYAKRNPVHIPQNVLTLSNALVYVGSYSFFRSPSIFGCSVFLSEECLFVSVQSWTFSLYKASSSCLVLHVTELTPQAIYQKAVKRRERSCQREFQHRESEARRSTFNRSTAPMMILERDLQILRLNALKLVSLFSWIWCEVKAMLLCLSLAHFLARSLMLHWPTVLSLAHKLSQM